MMRLLENVMNLIQPDEPDLSESMNYFFSHFNSISFAFIDYYELNWVKFEQISL